MPLRYTSCAICDRPVASYRFGLLHYCSRKCYFTFWRMLAVAIRDKELRKQIIDKASELTRLAA